MHSTVSGVNVITSTANSLYILSYFEELTPEPTWGNRFIYLNEGIKGLVVLKGNAPVSSGDLEPSGRKKKRTVSSAARTVNSAVPRTRAYVKDDDLELDSGEVDAA